MDEGLLGEVRVQQRDAFKVVQRTSRRLMGMIDQLLAFSRFDVPDASETGAARLEPTAFDLAEVAAQVVGSVRAGEGAARELGLEAAPGGGGAPAGGGGSG